MRLKIKLILLFTLLLILTSGSIFITSAYKLKESLTEEANYRMTDMLIHLHTASQFIDNKSLKSVLKKFMNITYKSNDYTLNIASISIKKDNKNIKVSRIIKGKTISFILKKQNKEIASAVYSITGLHKTIEEILIKQGLISLLILFLGIFSIFFFSHTLTRKLTKLTKAMDKISNHNYKVRISINSKDEIGKLANHFNSMAQSLEEGEFAKTVLKRYVTKQVAENILKKKNELKLEGDKRNIAVLFGDIRGFTKLSSNMEPEKIIALLNDFFSIIIDIIIKYDGVLDKFIGDGFLAFWNAPLDQKDYIEKSCDAAIEIVNAIKRKNINRIKNGQTPVEMGMGINIGQAIAGNVGSEKRMDYTVIGNTVNIAERVEGFAPNTTIYVTKAVYELIKGDYILNFIGLKKTGENIKLEVHELIRRKDVLS